MITRFTQLFFSSGVRGLRRKRLSVIRRVRAQFSTNFFSPFIRTNNSQLHLHTFHSFPLAGGAQKGGAITNNQSNESGEWSGVLRWRKCENPIWILRVYGKHNFSSDSCGNFSSQKSGKKKNHMEIFSRNKNEKRLKRLLLSICRLNVLENVCKF